MKRMLLVAALMFAALALLPAAGFAQTKEDAIRIHKEAYALQEKAQSHADLKQAEQKYLQAISIYKRVGERSGLAYACNSVGLIYAAWGQYDKALEYYEKSVAIARGFKDRKGEAIALNNLGNVHRNCNQHDKAVEYYEKSLGIARELKDSDSEANALANLGNVYQAWGQYDKAVQHYEKSLAIKRELKNRGGESAILNNLGVVYKVWNQYDKAVEYHEKSLAIRRELNDFRSEGQSLHNLGDVYQARGQYDKAVQHYEMSLAIKRGLKDPEGEGATLNNLGTVFSDWAQYDKAVECYEKSLAIKRELKDRKGEGSTLHNLGNIRMGWGQHDQAVKLYEIALTIFREIKDPRHEGSVLMGIGYVHKHREEHEKAVEIFHKALSLFTEIKVPANEPKALIADTYMDTSDLVNAEPLLREVNSNPLWGRFYLLKSDFAKAKEYYDQAFRSFDKNRHVKGLFTAYTGLGAACEGLKDYAGAADYYEKAVKLAEEIRSSLPAAEREKFFEAKTQGFSRGVPYEGLARVQMRLNKPQEAFKTTEHTRARVFSEAMSRLSKGKDKAVPAEILRQDEDFNIELAAKKKSLQTGYEKNNKIIIQSLEPQVKEMEGKLQTHIKMLRDKYPLFAATKYPQPMDLSQTVLKDNEWVLSYDVTDPGIIVYLTRGKTLLKGLFKSIARKEIDSLVTQFRNPLEPTPEESDPSRSPKQRHELFIKRMTSFDFQSGKKLADILLGDILSILPKGTPLTIVPGGPLGVLPFEMLVLNDGGRIAVDKDKPHAIGAEFLGDRNPISYYQSVTALTLARTLGKQKGSGQKMLVMDDPVFEPVDPRFKQFSQEKRLAGLSAAPDKLLSAIKQEWKSELVFTRLERTSELGQALKNMEPARTDEFTGMEASKKVLFEKPLDGYGSMVFATHGYFGKELPGIMEPVLVFTLVNQLPGKDGFLRLSEVMGLKLNADIVALTACQTGLGRHISGEGTMGMGRAFQYAGAKSVLMSLWSVSEQASVNLVESFFRNLKEGKTKLEALRLARQEIRQSGFDHPFYWAPFILVGETGSVNEISGAVERQTANQPKNLAIASKSKSQEGSPLNPSLTSKRKMFAQAFPSLSKKEFEVAHDELLPDWQKKVYPSGDWGSFLKYYKGFAIWWGANRPLHKPAREVWTDYLAFKDQEKKSAAATGGGTPLILACLLIVLAVGYVVLRRKGNLRNSLRPSSSARPIEASASGMAQPTSSLEANPMPSAHLSGCVGVQCDNQILQTGGTEVPHVSRTEACLVTEQAPLSESCPEAVVDCVFVPASHSEETRPEQRQPVSTESIHRSTALAPAVTSHKKYQPDRADILWNTDWGIPLDQMSNEEGALKGFRSYMGRWVTPEQRKTLKDQYASYRSIRVIAVLTLFGGVVTTLLFFVGWTKSGDGNIAMALVIGWGCLTGTMGIGLCSFRRWARNIAALLLVVSILSLIPSVATGAGKIQPASIVVAGLFLYCLFRKTAGHIFGKKVEEPWAQELTHFERLEEVTEDISQGILTREALLKKYEITQESLRRYCNHFMFHKKISDSDYLRIVGEPFLSGSRQ